MEWRKTQLKLLKKKNVVAVGLGLKQIGGIMTGEAAIVCSVAKKVKPENLSKKDMIPQKVAGLVTDVIETGIFKALKARTDRWRPAPGGVSIGHPEITAGTLGCIVKKNGELFILSNNHVLANSNNAEVGDQTLQPGDYDGGLLTRDRIGKLAEFVFLNFRGGPSDCQIGKGVVSSLNVVLNLLKRKTRLQVISVAEGDNLVDAAIAKPINDADVKREILEIGVPVGIVEGTLGKLIQKSGRTTALTKGKITQVDVSVQVQYGEGKIALFVDQLMAGEMCSGGDSGSVVLDMNRNLVGLLFAGSETTTVINRIQNVFDLLGLTL